MAPMRFPHEPGLEQQVGVNARYIHQVFPKVGVKPPKSSILIGFSITFTIHFGGFTPIFGKTHMLQ